MRRKWLLIVFAASMTICASARAEAVEVKYRGAVDLAPFDCRPLDTSSRSGVDQPDDERPLPTIPAVQRHRAV